MEIEKIFKEKNVSKKEKFKEKFDREKNRR